MITSDIVDLVHKERLHRILKVKVNPIKKSVDAGLPVLLDEQ